MKRVSKYLSGKLRSKPLHAVDEESVASSGDHKIDSSSQLAENIAGNGKPNKILKDKTDNQPDAMFGRYCNSLLLALQDRCYNYIKLFIFQNQSLFIIP